MSITRDVSGASPSGMIASQRGVEGILDAAAIVFADKGYDITTLDEVALKAGIQLGVLHQSFATKQALFEALAERCLARSREAFDLLLPSGLAAGSWEDVLNAMVNTFASLHHSDISFKAVVYNFQHYGIFAKEDLKLHQHLVDSITTVLEYFAPELSKLRRRAAAELVVTSIAMMLFLSHRSTPAMAKTMLSETKLMLRKYLEACLAGEPASVA